MLISDIKPGEKFRYIDSYFNPPRIYYMRKMKRKPRYNEIIGRECIPLQCYGFKQGSIDRFRSDKPSHWCVDGRYLGEEGWEPKAPPLKKKRKYKPRKSTYQGEGI